MDAIEDEDEKCDRLRDAYLERMELLLKVYGVRNLCFFCRIRIIL